MPAGKNLISALFKHRNTRSQDPHSSRPSPFTNPEVAPTPKPEIEIPDHLHNYITYLKQLYTDVTYEDLTATLNHCNGTDFSVESIVKYHAYLNERSKKYHDMLVKIGPRRVAYFKEYDGFGWEFCAKQTDSEFNEPIRDLVLYRRQYEVAMAELKRTIPPDAPVLWDDRTEDIKRLSRWIENLYRQPQMNDFRDLSAATLERIYEAREKDRKAHCDKENLEHNYSSSVEPPEIMPEYRRYEVGYPEYERTHGDCYCRNRLCGRYHPHGQPLFGLFH
ncbi:MAG: hypothetical protein Q9168_004979 [Polycauliona sp. 1 TL-2023]